MGKKIINPFREAKTLNEFFKLLRADLERIRGKRFAYWKVEDVSSADGSGLRFRIETSTTKGVKSWQRLSWLQVAENTRGDLPGWDGYNIFKGPFSPHSGKTKNTLAHFAWLELRHLPHIKKMCRQNRDAIGKRIAFRGRDAKYNELVEKRNHLDILIGAQHAALEQVARQKYPLLDLSTGLPTQE